jgi:hypothetical protein
VPTRRQFLTAAGVAMLATLLVVPVASAATNNSVPEMLREIMTQVNYVLGNMTTTINEGNSDLELKLWSADDSVKNDTMDIIGYLDSLEADVAGLQSDLDSLAGDLGGVNTTVNEINTTVSDLETALGNIGSSVQILTGGERVDVTTDDDILTINSNDNFNVQITFYISGLSAGEHINMWTSIGENLNHINLYHYIYDDGEYAYNYNTHTFMLRPAVDDGFTVWYSYTVTYMPGTTLWID